MNYLKRIFVSIERRKGKSLLLFLIVFLLGNVIAGAVAIQQSTMAVEENINEKLGSNIAITLSSTGAEKYMGYSYSEGMGIAIYNIDKRVVKVYDLAIEDTRVEYAEYVHSLPYYLNDEVVKLLGVQRTYFTDLELDNILIVNGRTFNEDEIVNGSSVIVLDQEYANNHNLSVGNSIVFTTQTLERTYDTSFEIIGFYTRLVESSSSNYWREQNDLTNQFYVPQVVLDEEFEYRLSQGVTHDDVMGQMWLRSMVFKVDDSSKVRDYCNLLKERINNQMLAEVEVQSSSNSYDAVAGPLESLEFIAWIVLGLAIVISLVIISLVVTMFLKDREHEMGIYLSLGERKWRITTQIVLEVYLVGILAITLSMFTGNVVGDMVASEVLSTQYEKQQEIIEMKLEELHGVDTEIVNTTIVLDEFEVKFSLEYFVMFYAVGSLVLIVSSYVPIRKTLKVKPKEILM